MTPLFANLFSPQDILIVLVVGVLLFGRKLPDVGRYLGRSITEFKKGMHGLEDDMDVFSQKAPRQQEPSVQEPMRPPQRVVSNAPKFEDAPYTSTTSNQPHA